MFGLRVGRTNPRYLIVIIIATGIVAGAARPVVAVPFDRSPGPRCGSSGHVVRTPKRVWVCTFDDEFNDRTVDPQRWRPQTTAISGFRTADTCYLDSPANVFERGGRLHLVARTTAAPGRCPDSTPFSTRRTGGALVSYGLFSQAYGRFEMRAAYPNTGRSGFWGNFWLYSSLLKAGGPKPGEVDIAEHWSGHGAKVYPSLHYAGSTTADSAYDCAVAKVGRFHTYRLDWSPTQMTFYYDGATCFTRTWDQVTGSGAPFDQPFFLVLSEGFGDPALPMSKKLPRTGPMLVDWVRVYR